ncbi:GDP-mannose 4,6-dehydratase [Aeromicrobium sp. A1-2]|uniref:GDP-mannose 4,6-dehydratase n=1 Tax=Aeromicrobium sp. A1-2 TaxID=2107713 RepID=UPI000E53E31F|nr:GDP-mannose 4,6-dehydratase [Aeromicrobium sp. A1-2]AXT86218.1 GDP-mannose 4,6-dehydratase [Aeromicrobium sp. A1-2]
MQDDRTALITGVAGQDGMYLARLLRSNGWRVVGTVRPDSQSTARTAPYLAGVELVEHELTDSAEFAGLLDRHAPNEVYNLAGFSSVGRSWSDPELVLRTNTTAVVEMLEALLRHRDVGGREVRFFQASSAEVFGGDVKGSLNEETSHRPRTPYAIAKSAAHHAVVSYREKYDLFACNGILFNHESPFRGHQFVAGKIARVAAEIACGRDAKVSLGDIDIERDWGAAVDYVDAMRLSLQHDRADDYVIATGTTRTLRQMLTTAFAAAGVDDPMPHLELDHSLWSSTQAAALQGDATRALVQLGWAPATSFETLVSDMVDVDVRRIRSGVAESADYVR